MPRRTLPVKKALFVLLLASLLSGCLGAILARAGTDIVLAILRPLVGLDPNSNGLFQQPVIKDRMQAFLGEQYDPVMQLLRTADQLQQEGPLYFVISRYTPIPQVAEKAGFVWNAETNQMAVMLVTGGSPTVIAEKILLKQANAAVQEAVPQWPVELQAILDEDALKKQAAEAAQKMLQEKLQQEAQQALDAALQEEEL
jgi:hypothetical protein